MAVFRVVKIDFEALIRIRAFGTFTIKTLKAVLNKEKQIAQGEKFNRLFDLRGCFFDITSAELTDYTEGLSNTKSSPGLNALLLDKKNEFAKIVADFQSNEFKLFTEEVDAFKWLGLYQSEKA